MKRLALFALLAGLAACITEPKGTPSLPANAVAYAPLDSYPAWWAQVEACSGLTRDLGELAFYEVPGISFPVAGRQVGGQYLRPSSIVMAGATRNIGIWVRHEMLHALLRATVDDHPAEYFRARCGKIIVDEHGDYRPWEFP